VEFKKHVVMFSDTVTQNDPRVSKFARTYHSYGWEVTTVGISNENGTGAQFPWRHFEIDIPKPYAITSTDIAPRGIKKIPIFIGWGLAKAVRPINNKASNLIFKAANRFGRGQSVSARLKYYFYLRAGLRMFPHRYAPIFWQSKAHYEILYQELKRQVSRCDLWIANDWDMLPIALKLAKEKGGKILYDSHEFAIDEFFRDKEFRKWKQPLINAVEKDCIGRVDAVSSVSPGICDALQSRYALPKKPLCIRNVPSYVQMPFRAAQGELVVLYQGIVAPGRGLEMLIESTRFWKSGRRLIIRGPVPKPGYTRYLENLIATHSSDINIIIEPPVALKDLIPAAHSADIGLMLLSGSSTHETFALPNKVFEYMMSGLALCVSNLPEMANVVNTHKTGLLVNSLEPAHIAATINRFDKQMVDDFKRASLATSKKLCWENESKKLLAIPWVL